jgi:hypothetical protein
MTDGAADLSTQAELRRLQGALELVTTQRDQLTAERNQVLSQAGGLQEAQARRARVQEEVATLERMRVRLTEAVDQARARFGGGQDPTSMTDQGPDPSPASEGSLPQEQVRAVQKVLTDLGYGPLHADGVMGSGTGAAIEAFERASGLAVTGELNARTIEALEKAAGVPLQ